MHPDSRNLSLPYPHPRQLWNPSTRDPEIRQRVDHRLFDRPHIRPHVALPFAQVHDGVAHHLSRPVIGNVPPPVRSMEGDTRARQRFFVRQQVLRMPVAAHGDRMRVLQQQQLIGNLAGLPPPHQLLLHLERPAVLHPPRLPQLAPMH